MVTALVLTGQLLPSGTAHAQDDAPKVADVDSANAKPEAAPVAGVVITPAGTKSSGEAHSKLEMVIRPAHPKPVKVSPPPKIMAVRPVNAGHGSANVTVQVTQIAGTSFQPWGVHPIFAEPSLWRGPTSAYLFDRPLPYWQLRSDFHHLRPWISRFR